MKEEIEKKEERQSYEMKRRVEMERERERRELRSQRLTNSPTLRPSTSIVSMLHLPNSSRFHWLRTPLERIRSRIGVPVESDFLPEESASSFCLPVGGDEPRRRDETEGRTDLVVGSSGFHVAEESVREGIVRAGGEEGADMGEGIDGGAVGGKKRDVSWERWRALQGDVQEKVDGTVASSSLGEVGSRIIGFANLLVEVGSEVELRKAEPDHDALSQFLSSRLSPLFFLLWPSLSQRERKAHLDVRSRLHLRPRSGRLSLDGFLCLLERLEKMISSERPPVSRDLKERENGVRRVWFGEEVEDEMMKDWEGRGEEGRLGGGRHLGGSMMGVGSKKRREGGRGGFERVDFRRLDDFSTRAGPPLYLKLRKCIRDQEAYFLNSLEERKDKSTLGLELDASRLDKLQSLTWSERQRSGQEAINSSHRDSNLRSN